MEKIPKKMRAVAVDKFGGMDKLTLKELPVPSVGPDEILIRVEAAGVGVWDPFEVEGGFAKMMNIKPQFPYVPGADGAGTVEAVGSEVTRFKEGDRVYGFSEFNGRGFYAEYVTVKEDEASVIPKRLSIEQAGAMPVDAITALRGLDNALKLKQGESIMIFGASGGIGHLAVQLAKHMGARVFAVASGQDGVDLVRSLGADFVIDGHSQDISGAARTFAPKGFDCALLTAGGSAAEKALTAMRQGGRVAYPNGVEPEPKLRADLKLTRYDGLPDIAAMDKLNRMIDEGPFEVHIAGSFELEQAAEAARAMGTHHLGKIELRPGA